MQSLRIVEYDYFMCDICREYVYDESAGDATRNIRPRTRVEMLPASWQCPLCGAGKDRLRAATLFDYFTYDNSRVDRTSQKNSGEGAHGNKEVPQYLIEGSGDKSGPYGG